MRNSESRNLVAELLGLRNENVIIIFSDNVLTVSRLDIYLVNTYRILRKIIHELIQMVHELK